jgi:hypothetical protein
MGLEPAEPGALPWFWQQAPLPQPQFWLQRPVDLQCLATAAPLPASEAALAALRGAPEGGSLVLRDAEERLWVLRPCAAVDGGRLWQAQEVAQARVLLFDRLRGALGRRLAGPVRHELTGPLQTLSFSAEIAQRMGGNPGDPRFAANLETIGQCVHELHQRQSAAVSLWLAPQPGVAPPVALREVLAEAEAMVRAHLGAPLRSTGLSLLEGVLLPGPGHKLRLGWLALLWMAGRRASRTGGENRGLKLSVARGQGLVLELDGPAGAEALGPEFAAQGDAAALATAAVVLEEAGLELLPQDGRGIRLQVHALRQEECTKPGGGVTPRLGLG